MHIISIQFYFPSICRLYYSSGQAEPHCVRIKHGDSIFMLNNSSRVKICMQTWLESVDWEYFHEFIAGDIPKGFFESALSAVEKDWAVDWFYLAVQDRHQRWIKKKGKVVLTISQILKLHLLVQDDWDRYSASSSGTCNFGCQPVSSARSEMECNRTRIETVCITTRW